MHYILRRYETPHSFDLYLPRPQTMPKGKPPLICITPLLGRIFFLEDLAVERWFAGYFTRHGLAVALIHRPIFEFAPARGLEQIQDYLTQSISRAAKILDALENHPELDTQKIGTFGISFGAIVNLLWAASDPRLKAHVFALGGGNLPEIFIRSRDPLMRSYQRAALEATGGSVETLKLHLQKVFTRDPLEACASLPKENILLVLALFDRVIPIRYGLALRQKLGNPETIFLPLGHYSSILAAPILRGKILRFFQVRFGIKPGTGGLTQAAEIVS